MHRPYTSSETTARLSNGISSAGVPAYVGNVRVAVNACKDSGSQQHRLRHQDQNWIASQYRWIVEQRAAGESWEKITAVLQACLDEAHAMALLTEQPDAVSFETVMEDNRAERAAGFHEDAATDEALYHKSPGPLRRMAQNSFAQARALMQKGRRAIALSNKLLHRSA